MANAGKELVREPTPSELNNNVPVTVRIPAGPFWMGSDPDDSTAHDNEKPRLTVDLPDYQIGRYPITNAQYARFLAAKPSHSTPYSNERGNESYNWNRGTRTYPKGKANHPLVLVNLHDAMAYCGWLSEVTGQIYRLPTEEEWEKAARGGLPSVRRYPWGDEWQPGICNTQELERNGTTSIHEFEQTTSPFGAVGMAGHVWEWTVSGYGPYSGSQYKSHSFIGIILCVVRGGSWRNSKQEARVSCRGRYQFVVRRSDLGFRIVCDGDSK